MVKNKKNYNISKEVLKFPYNANFEKNDSEIFSEKFCYCIIIIRKRIIKTIKWSIFCLQISGSIGNAVIPSQTIGLTILPPNPPIIRFSHSNADLSKQGIIFQVLQQMPAEIELTQKEMDELYLISVKCKNNSISQKEVINQITNLRGGAFIDVVAILGAIGFMLILIYNAEGFQTIRPVNLPPHLQWLYGDNYKPGQFGYGKSSGPRSITVAGMTENSGSDKKNPSSGSYEYADIMRELDSQAGKKIVEIKIDNEIYILESPYKQDVTELRDKLADQIYDSIRECDTDISDIAENLGFKAENIKNVKDHVFYQKHQLDMYVSLDEEVEYRRFDPTLQQALSWKRLETGTHTEADTTWIKHEFIERNYELKHGSGYREAHQFAQTRFDGFPWSNDF